MEEIINNFILEKECCYKGRVYSVRDNGAIFRHSKHPYKPSKLDNHWTFGKKDKNTGYLFLNDARVHIIVATAFFGERDSNVWVVDHKDTNRCNNRPENLRWVTRLENALNNPITKKKIILICGSIENFLLDPSILNGHEWENRDFSWMRTVTKEEGLRSLKRMSEWATSPSAPSGNGKMGEWIFEESKPNKQLNWGFDDESCYDATENEFLKPKETFDMVQAVNPNVIQLHNWKTPCDFLLCPQGEEENPLLAYYNNLEKGKVFFRNPFYETRIIKFSINEDCSKLWVVNDGFKMGVAEIFYSDGIYYHKSLGTFFDELGVEKALTLARGECWNGPESIDDFC